MADQATITVHRETRDKLDSMKREGETWDGLMRRLADERAATGADGAAEADLDRVLDELRHLPDRTAEEVETRLRR